MFTGRPPLRGGRALRSAAGALLRDAAHRRGALEGVDQLFLVRPPAVSEVAATLNPFLDLARELGVQHVIFLSVQGAEARPRIPHHAVEAHIERTWTDWTHLRPGFFAQNFTDAYRRDIVEDDRLYVPAGDGQVAFVDTADLAAVAALVFQAPQRHQRAAYTLTGPRTFTFHDAAQLLTRLTGRSIRYVPASVPGYLLHLLRRRRAGLMQAVIQAYLHYGLRAGEAATVSPTLEALLGRPGNDLEAMLTRESSSFVKR
ncbi:MAG: NmrA family NAD(P)-binding protein [Archangium sp.]